MILQKMSKAKDKVSFKKTFVKIYDGSGIVLGVRDWKIKTLFLPLRSTLCSAVEWCYYLTHVTESDLNLKL